MCESMVSIPAALLRFKDINAVLNSLVFKSKLHMASLKTCKCSVKLVETDRSIYIRKERVQFIRNLFRRF